MHVTYSLPVFGRESCPPAWLPPRRTPVILVTPEEYNMAKGFTMMVYSDLPPRPVVEVEEVVYSYAPANNGAGPMWCYGSSCIARIGSRVFVCGLETISDAKPLNNCRWVLYERVSKGWRAAQADESGRQREPCPIGVLSGSLVISTNPSLDPMKEGGSPAKPHVIKIPGSRPRSPGTPLQPAWSGTPAFTEHSYRGLGVDGNGGELVLVNNVGYDEQHWSFLDRTGKWSNHGVIRYPIRGCYPCVALRDRECHVFAVGDIVEPVDEWRSWKKEATGRDWDYVFRRLFYAYNPNAACSQFLRPVEIDNVESTGGFLGNRDLWIGPDGAAHLLYCKTTVQSPEFRDRFFPGVPIQTSLEYCIVRDGKVAARRTLFAGGELGGEIVSFGRFHSAADGRLFVVYHCTGRDNAGKPLNEIRIVRIPGPNDPLRPVSVPLQVPFSSFMTASERGGSAPSNTIDMLGVGTDPYQIRYARIRLR